MRKFSALLRVTQLCFLPVEVYFSVEYNSNKKIEFLLSGAEIKNFNTFGV